MVGSMSSEYEIPSFEFTSHSEQLRKVFGQFPLDEDYKKMQQQAERKAQEYWLNVDKKVRDHVLENFSIEVDPARKKFWSYSDHFVPLAVKITIIDAEMCKLWFEAVPTWEKGDISRCFANLELVKEHDTKAKEYLEEYRQKWQAVKRPASSSEDESSA
ncbi:MAG: hypothetical protein Q9169_002142 [Polycauliona sp. 2 TL-2023]